MRAEWERKLQLYKRMRKELDELERSFRLDEALALVIQARGYNPDGYCVGRVNNVDSAGIWVYAEMMEDDRYSDVYLIPHKLLLDMLSDPDALQVWKEEQAAVLQAERARALSKLQERTRAEKRRQLEALKKELGETDPDSAEKKSQ